MIQRTRITVSKFILLLLFSIAFLSLYFLLSYNNRLAADDFYFLKNLNDHGIWNAMLAAYHSWVTRWFAILFLNVVLTTYTLFHSLLPYHLFTIIVLIFVLMKLIRVVADKILHIRFSFATLLFHSILLLASFFFFTFNIGETWFWITSTAMYLWSIIFLIAGFTIIIQNKITLLKGMLLILCFLFIGGASESIAINTLFLLGGGIVYFNYRNKFSLRNFWSDNRNKMLFIAIVSVVAALLISYAGEGRSLRQSALPDTGLMKAKFISLKLLVKLVLFQLPLKIHWFIFFSVPWIVLGQQFSLDKKESLEKILSKIFKFFLLFMLLSFISFIPVSYLLGETGPFRTWIMVSFYLTLCCAVCGFYLGCKADLNKKLLNRMFAISLLTLLVLLIINIKEQNEITSVYAKTVDERMHELIQLKEQENKNTVELNALPPSGMLLSSEISEDSSHFTNRHIKNFLDLKFDIRKK